MGAAFWLTGLPGSGKTTLAQAAGKEFPKLVLLHMDEMRSIVTPAPMYSDLEREHLYLSLVYAAMVMTRAGTDVLIDATGNRAAWREKARALIPRFHEIYLKCPIDLCREREKVRVDKFAPKGVYKKAEAGWPVPGVNVPYEEPQRPELVIDSGGLTLEEASGRLAGYIRGVLTAE